MKSLAGVLAMFVFLIILVLVGGNWLSQFQEKKMAECSQRQSLLGQCK